VDFNKVEVKDVDVPRIGAGEVLIKVEACGICRSDWHLWRGDPSLVAYMQWAGGKLPLIMGHEVFGRVEEVGDGVAHVRRGDYVVVPASSTGDSRTCRFCREGASNVCERLWIPGFGSDGCYAQYMRVPAGSVIDLVKVPEALRSKKAWLAITGCGMGTAFNAVVDKARVKPGEWVVITGVGGVGLSAVAIATRAGAKVLAVDINQESLERARKLGAVDTLRVSPTETDLAGKITRQIGGLADVGIDTTGNPNVEQQLTLAVRPGGRVVLAGLMVKGAETLPLPADVVVAREISIQGALMLPAQRYEVLFGLLARGDVNLDPVIYREISVDEVPDALRAMSEFRNAGRFVVTKF